MKTLSIAECQRDLSALDAADVLTSNMKKEIDRLKEMDTKTLMSRATKMLMTGNLSLEALGLPVNLFEQLEQLEKLNGVARMKYRAVVTDNLNQLEAIEEAEVIEHE